MNAIIQQRGAPVSHFGGKREKLLVFLNQCVDPSREFPLHRLEAVHNVIRRNDGVIDDERAIGRWETSPEVDTAKLATQILDYLQADAEGHGPGMQHYYLFAYFGDAEVWEMRHAMYFGNGRAQGGGGGGFGGGSEAMPGSEGPNPAGIIAQSHRHTEFFAQAVIALSGEGREILREELDRIRQENNDLRAENRMLRTDLDNVRNAEADREQQRFKQKLWSDALKEAMQIAKVMAPYLVSYFAGGPVLPADTTPILESLSGTFESLNDQKVAAIAQILGPINMVPIMELYKVFKERQMKRDGVATPSANANAGLPDPAAIAKVFESFTEDKLPQIVSVLGHDQLGNLMGLHDAYKKNDTKTLFEKLFGLFETVPEEKFEKLIAVLGPLRTIPLVQLYNTFKERQGKQEAGSSRKEERAAPPVPPPAGAGFPFDVFAKSRTVL